MPQAAATSRRGKHCELAMWVLGNCRRWLKLVVPGLADRTAGLAARKEEGE
jgi:hypothetical protein